MQVKVEVNILEAIRKLSDGLAEWGSYCPTKVLIRHLKETKELRRLLDILDKSVIQHNREYNRTHKVIV